MGAITVKNDRLDNVDDENKSNNYSSDCFIIFQNISIFIMEKDMEI
jgi:hypothetical protein